MTWALPGCRAARRRRRRSSRWPRRCRAAWPTMVKKPCICPSNRRNRTGTSAFISRVAYSSPSSRSTSCSAVMTTAGGRPGQDRRPQRRGVGVLRAQRRPGRNGPRTTPSTRRSAAAGSPGRCRTAHPGRSRSPGRSAPAARSAGRPPWAARRATTAARLPPALSPATISGTRAPARPGQVLVRPAQRRPAVLDRGRVAVLRRQPVADQDHGAPGALGQVPAEQRRSPRCRPGPSRRRGSTRSPRRGCSVGTSTRTGMAPPAALTRVFRTSRHLRPGARCARAAADMLPGLGRGQLRERLRPGSCAARPARPRWRRPAPSDLLSGGSIG